jgi:Smg protein
MKQSLSKLVDVILEKIEENPDKMTSESGIRAWLRGQGYGPRDIDAAMRLLGRRIEPRPAPQTSGLTAIRVYSEWEESKLSPEARQALTRLELHGLLDAYEREMILDKAYQIEGRIDVDGLDYLLGWVAGSLRDVESQRTLYDVLDDRKDLYH